MTPHDPSLRHWLEHRVAPLEDGWEVREVLLRSLRLSRQMIRRLAQTRGIRLNASDPFLSTRVGAGDLIEVRLVSDTPSGLRPVEMELEIVREDPDLVVIDKPAGVLVHPTRRSHVRTLAHGLVAHFERQGTPAGLHPVHRLDRDTSGLVLFAKHSVAHQRLDRQLRGRTLQRRYLAVVHGRLEGEQGRVDAPIARSPDEPHLRTSAAAAGSEAGTRYRVVERLHGGTLVEVALETGRTHQIRVHMAHLGHPLVGDVDYGGTPHPLCERQALHAWRLHFTQPFTGEAVRCEASLPADLRRLVEGLRELRGDGAD